MPPTTILLIDDDRHVHISVREQLSEVADQIVWASMPGEGIRLAMQEPPDLILLDINMPNMDGLKVCRHLKETESTRDVPILFLTVESDVESLARALDCGGADYILKPFNEIDLRARVRAALRTKAMIDLLKEQARLDALTGLPNRAVLDGALSSATAAHNRHGQAFALLVLDVDHFRKINEEHGHGLGDEMLRDVAAALRLGCRPYDTPCRFGGGKFAIVLGQTEGDDAERAARRILEGLSGIEVTERSSRRTPVTCSAGLATSCAMPPDFCAADIQKAAESALDEAKRSGRNRLCVADPARG